MARTKSATLTDAELRLMEILWDLGSATAADIVDALPGDRRLAHTTVLTTLRILEDKGYVEHTKEGKAFAYRPLVDRTTASRSAMRHLMSRFFRNSPELLVSNLISDEQISRKELARLKELIKKSEEA